MGSPYLNSGEAIVLTTNRVSADAVTYDVMLTTERIFLIENRSERFEPEIIPLSTILSVQGGTTPAHDPVITLLFRSGVEKGARQPLNLVFFQNPPENRKSERDDWIRSIIQLSINQHERELVPETPVIAEAAKETGLHPSVRHSVALEMVRPFSNVVDHRTPVTPVTVIPDEVEGSSEIPARVPAIPRERDEKITPEQEAEESVTHLTPVRGSQPRRANVIIPQITEEALPAPAGATPLEEEEPAPQDDTEARDYSIQTPVRSLTVTEKPVPEPLRYEEPAMEPAVIAVETGPEETADVPSPAATAQREVAEITGEQLPIPAGAVPPEEQEEPAPFEDAEAQGCSHQTAIPSMTVNDESAQEPQQDEEPVMEPAVPLIEIGPEQAAAVPPSAATEPREVAETIRALHSGAGEPDPDAGMQESPESHFTATMTENAAKKPLLHPADAGIPQEPAAKDAPPVRYPAPPAGGIRPIRTTLLYTTAVLLIVVLVVIGAVVLFPQGPGQSDIPVNPAPTLLTVTTLPPEPLRPATVTPASVTPVNVTSAATRITTPVPSLPASPVIQAGVWVRVNSTAYYIGRIGNPGLMQQISGSGDYFYKVLRNDRPVQVSVQKQDNSGALLAIAIYRDGTLIGGRSVTSPMGSVDLLIDPLTARVPGLTENDTLPEHAGTPTGLENY